MKPLTTGRNENRGHKVKIWEHLVSASSPGGSDGKESACHVGDPCLIPGWEDLLEKEMVAHSSILAWRNAWTL